MRTYRLGKANFSTRQLILAAIVAAGLFFALAGALLKQSADATAQDYTDAVNKTRASYAQSAKKFTLSNYMDNGQDDTSQAVLQRSMCTDASRLEKEIKTTSMLPSSLGGFLSKKYQDAKKMQLALPADAVADYAKFCNFYVLDTERRYDTERIQSSAEYKAVLSGSDACGGAPSCIRTENYARLIPFVERIVTIQKTYYEKQRSSDCPFKAAATTLCTPYNDFEKEVYELWNRYLAALKAGDSKQLGQVVSEFKAAGPLKKLDDAAKQVDPTTTGANNFYKKQLVAVEAKILAATR